MAVPTLARILYVDDEPDIREVVSMALGLNDSWQIDTCSCGEEALARLPVIKPDLVMLDVMMPGLDGPATLARMRNDPAFAGIPVVFITAKAMPSEVARFIAMGATGVIAKPFDPMQLAHQVGALWEGIRR